MALPEIDNIEVPGAYEVSVDRVSVGSRERSPSGTLISNIIAVKKVITISCRPKDKATFDALLSHLDDNNFGEVDLEADELDEITTVVPTEATTTTVLDLMGAYTTPIELTLSFEEV